MANLNLTNLKFNAENVWVGDAVFKFYHGVRCPYCNYAGKGYNDTNSEGPWDFECFSCNREWSVVMEPNEKEVRKHLLKTLHEIDFLIGSAKATRRHVKA